MRDMDKNKSEVSEVRLRPKVSQKSTSNLDQYNLFAPPDPSNATKSEIDQGSVMVPPTINHEDTE